MGKSHERNLVRLEHTFWIIPILHLVYRVNGQFLGWWSKVVLNETYIHVRDGNTRSSTLPIDQN